MSDGNVHVGEVETLVEAESEAPPEGSSPAEQCCDEETLRKAIARARRVEARTRAWGFDD